MAYVKTNWVNDVTPINAANLNKMENGIEANQMAFDTFASADKEWTFNAGSSGAGVNADGSLSIPANGYIQVRANAAKSGFTPMGIISFDFGGSGATQVFINRMYVSGNNLVVLIRNTSSSPTSNLTLSAVAIYKKA